MYMYIICTCTQCKCTCTKRECVCVCVQMWAYMYLSHFVFKSPTQRLGLLEKILDNVVDIRPSIHCYKCYMLELFTRTESSLERRALIVTKLVISPSESSSDWSSLSAPFI